MMKKNTSRRSGILVGERHTSVFNRFVAKSIDFVLIVAIYFVGDALWTPVGVITAIVFCALQDGLGMGQSVGKRIIGLRVLDDETGLPCSLQRSVVRNLPFILVVLFAGITMLWVFALLIALPLICVETYLVVTVETGVRIGDVLANTLVVEYSEERVDNLS